MARIFLYAGDAASAAELVAMAAASKGESTLFALGEAGDLPAAGADRVVVLKGGSARPEDYAEEMGRIVADEDGALFAAASTVHGREVAARVAAFLGCGMASDVSELAVDEAGVHAKRSIYGGAVVDSVAISGPAVATVAAGAFAPVAWPATTNVEERTASPDARVKRLGLDELPRGGVDLTKADRVVGVGLGLAEQGDLKLIEDLADALNAGIGCTRDFAEGRGWLPKEQYIGITGVQVKPQLYVAVGISGAMQHVFGIRDAKVVVAINKEKSAPIFRAADYGVVGDLYDVVPKLIAALK